MAAISTCGGMPFIYNKIPSEMYNVSMVFIDESFTDRPSGSGIELITDTIQRNARVIHLGSRQAPPLEFGIEIVFDEPVDIFVLTQVKDWIGGEIGFKEFQICAEYFNQFYFNAYIQIEEDLIYNGGYRGIRCTVHCDAPWAWELEDEIEYPLNVGGTTNIDFNNLSADSELLRPIIEFRMARAGNFSIRNTTNGNKTTTFTGLSANETVTLDNLYGIITSSTGLLRVRNFNKVFLKMPKDMNYLVVTGNASLLKIRFTNAKRIGGGYY